MSKINLLCYKGKRLNRRTTDKDRLIEIISETTVRNK